MENGLRFLAALQFTNASSQLNEALQLPGDKKVISQAIDACKFWQPLIPTTPSVTPIHPIKILLSKFASYHFIPQLAGLKKALITFIANSLCEEKQIDIENTISAFDLLLACKNFQVAEKLMTVALKQFPDKHDLLYLLAQGQWKNGHTRGANNNYIKALLYHPDETMVNRIENIRLREIAQANEPYLAPAYAWIQSVLPFVPLADDIKYWSEAHRKAVQAYQLLQQSEKSLKNNDLKASIRFRKELKSIDPILYQAYFKRLK